MSSHQPAGLQGRGPGRLQGPRCLYLWLATRCLSPDRFAQTVTVHNSRVNPVAEGVSDESDSVVGAGGGWGAEEFLPREGGQSGQ